MEKAAHKRIRKRFKHNIFNFELPPHSILHEDLFSKKSWRILGLKDWQLAIAGGAGGAAVGAKIDLATAGHSFAMGAIIGGIIGAGSAALGFKQAEKAKIKGLPLGRIKIQVGPVQNIQLMYVLIDRALIYFSHVINWAHSRREDEETLNASQGQGNLGFTAKWESSIKQQFAGFFKAARKNDAVKLDEIKARLVISVTKTLNDISVAKDRIE